MYIYIYIYTHIYIYIYIHTYMYIHIFTHIIIMIIIIIITIIIIIIIIMIIAIIESQRLGLARPRYFLTVAPFGDFFLTGRDWLVRPVRLLRVCISEGLTQADS